jgi:hypothetical protein
MRSVMLSLSLSLLSVALTSACAPRATVAHDEILQPGLTAAAAPGPHPGPATNNHQVANLRVTYQGAWDSGVERFVYIENLGPDGSGGVNLEVDGGGLIQVSRLHPLAPNRRRRVSLGSLPCDDPCRVTISPSPPVQDPNRADNQIHLTPPRGALLRHPRTLAPDLGRRQDPAAASPSI